jgi:glucose-6-phosphate-specific signal transduction histidine kinase
MQSVIGGVGLERGGKQLFSSLFPLSPPWIFGLDFFSLFFFSPFLLRLVGLCCSILFLPTSLSLAACELLRICFIFCFFAKDVRVLLLEMREDVGASPDNDLMTYPCFFLFSGS